MGYISRRDAAKTYWKDGKMSPALLRARARYRNRNILGGIVLFAGVTSIYLYSINAVRQDDFTDVDEEASVLRSAGSTLKSIEDEAKDKVEEAKRLYASTSIKRAVATSQAAERRGILADVAPYLMRSRTTWIDGAPPVDNIGLIGDSKRK